MNFNSHFMMQKIYIRRLNNLRTQGLYTDFYGFLHTLPVSKSYNKQYTQYSQYIVCQRAHVHILFNPFTACFQKIQTADYSQPFIYIQNTSKLYSL